jgi:hypothetical protein
MGFPPRMRAALWHIPADFVHPSFGPPLPSTRNLAADVRSVSSVTTHNMPPTLPPSSGTDCTRRYDTSLLGNPDVPKEKQSFVPGRLPRAHDDRHEGRCRPKSPPDSRVDLASAQGFSVQGHFPVGIVVKDRESGPSLTTWHTGSRHNPNNRLEALRPVIHWTDWRLTSRRPGSVSPYLLRPMKAKEFDSRAVRCFDSLLFSHIAIIPIWVANFLILRIRPKDRFRALGTGECRPARRSWYGRIRKDRDKTYRSPATLQDNSGLTIIPLS